MEKGIMPESELEEEDELESDLRDYHRKRGVTDQACLVAFFRRWVQPLR
jgi:hypothetical protein